MTTLFLPEPTGSFVFRDDATPIVREITVHYARANSDVRTTPITFAMHGIDRAAAGFRDVMAACAERNGQLILVPEFDLRQFPDWYDYNLGGVRSPPPENAVQIRELWTFGIIDRLFAYVQRGVASRCAKFNLFGLSAGAQFVLRYLALNEAPLVERVIAANCGVYMLPDLTLDYPAGMGGIGLQESDVRRYLARPLTILIGDRDADPHAHDLPRGEIAESQGPHRLARAQWYMAHCLDLAHALGMVLGWQYETVPGAGHVSRSMYDRASDILTV